MSLDHLQRQADAAPYLAKQAGRNRVVPHRPESVAPKYSVDTMIPRLGRGRVNPRGVNHDSIQ
jgi:hypothetical protein